MGALNTVNPWIAAWAGWLTVGAALAFWYYRARATAMGYTVVSQPANRSVSKPKSGVRPPMKPPQPKPDAFEELQTLLDGPDEVGE